MKQLYDQIVYGANFPGVVYATDQTSKAQSVLLLHPYGFPGGSITESLSCFQVIEPASRRSKALEIVSEAQFQAAPPLSRTPHAHLLNAEIVKYRLQQELQNSNVELLFHVVPHWMKTMKDGTTSISLLGKEGTIEVAGRTCVDASDDYGLAVLLDRKRIVHMRRLNIFITPLENDQVPAHPFLSDAMRLSDGRYWISLKIDTRDELFAEQAAQEMLDQFRSSLEKSGSRIQIVPLRTEVSYSLKDGEDITPRFRTLDDILERSFTPSEQVEKTLYLEKLLNT
jgi:hypothetical protein